MKKTKIIATIWPVTSNEEDIVKMYTSWANIIRFNFSHADYDNCSLLLNRIDKLNNSWKTKLSKLLDTKWPEIRTWTIQWQISYNIWDEFKIFVKDESLVSDKNIFCDYPYLTEDINIWDIIRIDSGLFDVEVLEKYENYVLVKAKNNAVIWSKRHINLPWIRLKLPWITEKDKEDILFWINNGFDFIAASFIRNKENIDEVRQFLQANNAAHIKIISKIENQEAIDNMDEIIENSDWVMVARGDLWIEVPLEKLPIYQKYIVQKCRKFWKISIIATHFLETMIDSYYPTRAEVNDIFNSILQKTDAIMLSWETAVWKYPIKCINVMKSIAEEAESFIKYTYEEFDFCGITQRDYEKKLLIRSAFSIWDDLGIKAVLIFTKSWLLARFASSFRSDVPIYAFSDQESSIHYMTALFGVSPIHIWLENYPWTILEDSTKKLLDMGKLSKEDKIISITDIAKNENEIPSMQILNIDDII